MKVKDPKNASEKSVGRRFFESMDILGETPTLNMNKNSNFKSIFGGVVTIFFYLCCIFSLIYYGVFLFKKDPTQVEYNSIYTQTYPTFDLWKSDFLIGAMILVGNQFVHGDTIRKNFNITLKYEKVTRDLDLNTGLIRETIESYDHKPQSCKGGPKANIYSKYVGEEALASAMLVDMSNCFYPDPNVPESANYFKVSSTPDSKVHERLTLMIGPCSPAIDSQCVGSLPVNLLAQTVIYMVMPEVGVDNSNGDNPISYAADSSRKLDFFPGFTSKTTFFMKTTEVYNFHEDFIGGNTFIQSKISIDTARNNWEQTTNYFTITWLSGNLKETVVRTFFGPLNWSSSIGGITSVISLICAGIYFFYGKYFYDKYLLKEVYTKHADQYLKEIKASKEKNPELHQASDRIMNSPADPTQVSEILNVFESKMAAKDLQQKFKNQLDKKTEFVNFIKSTITMKELQDKIIDPEKQRILSRIISEQAIKPKEKSKVDDNLSLKKALQQLYTDEPENEFHRELNNVLKELLQNNHHIIDLDAK